MQKGKCIIDGTCRSRFLVWKLAHTRARCRVNQSAASCTSLGTRLCPPSCHLSVTWAARAVREAATSSFDAGRRNDRVDTTGRNEDRGAAQVVLLFGLVHEHGTQEDRALHQSRLDEHDGRGDVGAVRVAKREDALRIEPVRSDRGANELRQLLSARTHFLRIEYPLGQTAEESRGGAFSRTLPRGLMIAAPGATV